MDLGTRMIHRKRRTSLLLMLALLLACTLTPSAAAKEQEQSGNAAPQTSTALPRSSGSQYAETDICQTCHQEVWDKHFAGTPHAALLKGDQHGCQACHGPGAGPCRRRRRRHQDHSLRDTESRTDGGDLHQVSPVQSGDAELFQVRAPGERRQLHQSVTVPTAPTTSTSCW